MAHFYVSGSYYILSFNSRVQIFPMKYNMYAVLDEISDKLRVANLLHGWIVELEL